MKTASATIGGQPVRTLSDAIADDDLDSLAQETLEDLSALDHHLISLARFEHRETGDTVIADRATRALIRLAVRYEALNNLSDEL